MIASEFLCALMGYGQRKREEKAEASRHKKAEKDEARKKKAVEKEEAKKHKEVEKEEKLRKASGQPAALK